MRTTQWTQLVYKNEKNNRPVCDEIGVDSNFSIFYSLILLFCFWSQWRQQRTSLSLYVVYYYIFLSSLASKSKQREERFSWHHLMVFNSRNSRSAQAFLSTLSSITWAHLFFNLQSTSISLWTDEDCLCTVAHMWCSRVHQIRSHTVTMFLSRCLIIKMRSNRR